MTDWNTTAELDAGVALGTKARQIDRQPRAAFHGTSALDPLPLFSLLAAVLEQESDLTLRREAIALLVAYDAASAAEDQSDRYEIAKVLRRVREDASIFAAYLCGRFPKGGFPPEHEPAAGQLALFEAAVAAKRTAAGLAPLIGTTY